MQMRGTGTAVEKTCSNGAGGFNIIEKRMSQYKIYMFRDVFFLFLETPS